MTKTPTRFLVNDIRDAQKALVNYRRDNGLPPMTAYVSADGSPFRMSDIEHNSLSYLELTTQSIHGVPYITCNVITVVPKGSFPKRLQRNTYVVDGTQSIHNAVLSTLTELGYGNANYVLYNYQGEEASLLSPSESLGFEPSPDSLGLITVCIMPSRNPQVRDVYVVLIPLTSIAPIVPTNNHPLNWRG